MDRMEWIGYLYAEGFFQAYGADVTPAAFRRR
jgi:hypothetical protein